MNDSVATQNASNNQRSILVVVCFALFFGVLNASSVTVLLPAIGADFSLDGSQISWIMSAYLLMYGVAIPFYGRLSDRFGAKKLFLIGVTLFSVGSLLCAIVNNFGLLMVARLIQAAGGAAFPGLGMTLASRAFAPEERGKALGIISATLGVGAAIGPLLAGTISDLLDWRYLFGISAIVAVVIPYAMKKLVHDENLSDGPLDLLGGIFLAIFVTGTLLAVSQGSQSGWTSPFVLGSMGAGLLSLIALIYHQARVDAPFIPKALLHNGKFAGVVTLGFFATGIFLASQVAFPMILTSFHQQSPFQIGLILMPGAILTAILGVIAGRMVDKIGARTPTRIGVILVFIAMLGLSVFVGSNELSILAFAALLGAGYALLNTPLAAVVSLVVPPSTLASALSLNTMIFFVGGSFGTAILTSLVSGHSGEASLNPLHNGQAVGFSDAFLFLTIPIFLLAALTFVLPKLEKKIEAAEIETPAEHIEHSANWKPDCSVPWMPECEARLRKSEEQLRVGAK
jgi:EmrB/QacA subfamily drug resistance transporter